MVIKIVIVVGTTDKKVEQDTITIAFWQAQLVKKLRQSLLKIDQYFQKTFYFLNSNFKILQVFTIEFL